MSAKYLVRRLKEVGAATFKTLEKNDVSEYYEDVCVLFEQLEAVDDFFGTSVSMAKSLNKSGFSLWFVLC